VNDRGTVLLMVLGVLALMAIIAVVYAAVGKADRSTSAAMVRSQRIEEQVDQIAQYMADTIGKDVFATYAQEDNRPAGGTNFTPPALRLEAYDAPDTDPMMISQRDGDNGQWDNRQRDGFYLFSPQGTITKPWRSINQPSGNGAPATRRDPRSPSDPYLAATEPTWVNRKSPDWQWRAYATGEDYLNLRDWNHISNLAPSGNFVNLWALRNNFRAESGFQRDNAGKARMSSQLTLINPATGYSYAAAGSNQDPNVDIGGAMRIGNLSNRARLNRPADWTRDQIGAFRTTSEFPQGGGGGNSPYGVDDPEFMPYQWADADGDGFYDARWFELVDISDPNNSRPVISNNGRARLFIASRVVDLSGLVNVNTASNFTFEPQRYFAYPQGSNGSGQFDPLKPVTRPLAADMAQPVPYQQSWNDYTQSVEESFFVPAGLTPADVDLQRLLRLSDASYAYRLSGHDVSYGDLPQPVANQNQPGDYRDYTAGNNIRNQKIGNAAYQAFESARLGDLAADQRYRDPFTPDPNSTPIANRPYIDTLKVAANRFGFYDSFGNRRDPARLATNATINRYGRPFDEGDELELRTFQGLNDPTRTSRLETVVAGRYQDDPDTYTLSPLRDNRPAELERAGRDIPQPDLASTAPSATNEYRKALLASNIDIRRLMTTISGSRPIIDNIKVDIKDTAPTQLSEASGTIRTDGARLVSRLVEPGNWSFLRNATAAHTPVGAAGPCDDNWRNKVAFAREDAWDDYGWFEDRDQQRTWYYYSLDNLAPPVMFWTPPNQGTPNQTPEGRIERVNAANPDLENYTESRLDLMREAFRAYLDCLMPYSQWGSNPAQTNQRNGPFPNAWDPTDLTARHLAYGGNPELAYRMAAHLAVNLRDALDVDRKSTADSDPNARVLVQDDNQQSAVSLDMTPAAVQDSRVRTTGLAGPVWPSYERDREYPWPKLNADNRFDSTDDAAAQTRLSPKPEWVQSVDGRGIGSSSTTYDPSGPVKRVNIFGIEAQPFITQVTAMSLFVDTPPTSLTPDADDEAAGQVVGIPGQPAPPPPNITINVERRIGNPIAGDPGNPDFLCVVLAFQLTNPFDTDIVLEPEDPAKSDTWYYVQYAGRYYRLAAQDKQQRDGLKKNAPEGQRVLHAGESRVFYATYPNDLEQVARRINRAQVALARRFATTEPALPTVASDLFENFAKHEFGEHCVHVAAMYPETGHAIGANSSGGNLTDVDLFSIDSQSSPDAVDVPAGPDLGEAVQPSFDENDTDRRDERRVVLLWRVLRDPDTIDGDAGDGRDPRLLALSEHGRSVGNWTGNDLLLDRLRDPSNPVNDQNGVLVNALIRPFPVTQGNSNVDVPGTQAGIDEPGQNARDNTGFSLISSQTITRPTNPPRAQGTVPPEDKIGTDPDGKAPTGAMPPWCMEAKSDNIYKPGFEQQSFSNRLWSLNRYRGKDGIGTASDYGNAIYPYYEKLEDLVSKHMTTTYRDISRSVPFPTATPNSSAPKFVDPDLSVQYAELRGARSLEQSTSGVNPTDPRIAYSIVDIDFRRIGAETQYFTGQARRFDEVAIEIHRLPPDKTGSDESQSTPSRALFSRVGDFLLPLAIGPWYDPSAKPDPTTIPVPTKMQKLDAQWTTLSEVLAMASDYYSGPEYLDAPQGSSGTRKNIFYKFAADTRGKVSAGQTPLIPKADRGQLVLDAWSPYLDYNPTTDAYQWQPLNPSDAAGLHEPRDAPLGNGIPLALNILDRFRVAGLPAETQAKPSDPRQCPTNRVLTNGVARPTVGRQFNVAGRSQAYGSSTRLVPGLINANTAPLSVWRLLPMLSPSPDLMDPTDLNLRDGWAYDGRQTDDTRALVNPLKVPSEFGSNATIPRTVAKRLWDDPTTAAPRQSPWDIAVSMVAYRDKSAMETRRFGGQAPILVDYRDNREDNQYPGIVRSGRDDAYRINVEDKSQGGLRDARGFKSLGEIMAVEMKRSTDTNVKNRANADGYNTAEGVVPDMENSITRLARDGASNNSLGIDSVGYKLNRARTVFGDMPGTGSPTDPGTRGTIQETRVVPDASDQISDDYDEKLSIANAILNSITVRSDVFCVWFVVNGYTPEDVQVDDGFPLVPSIARRYVMVVDRSNVDSPTTKPKIVMLREVPMP
jgi:hypothetical protein